MIGFAKSEDYGIILVHKLANEYNKRVVPLSEIARENKLSILFLRKIANDLLHAEVIEAVEGKKGGYRLAKNPKNIRIGQIIQAVSHKPLFSCCQNTADGKCHAHSCPHGFSLRRLHNQFLEKMSNIPLSHMLKGKTDPLKI